MPLPPWVLTTPVPAYRLRPRRPWESAQQAPPAADTTFVFRRLPQDEAPAVEAEYRRPAAWLTPAPFWPVPRRLADDPPRLEAVSRRPPAALAIGGGYGGDWLGWLRRRRPEEESPAEEGPRRAGAWLTPPPFWPVPRRPADEAAAGEVEFRRASPALAVGGGYGGDLLAWLRRRLADEPAPPDESGRRLAPWLTPAAPAAPVWLVSRRAAEELPAAEEAQRRPTTAALLVGGGYGGDTLAWRRLAAGVESPAEEPAPRRAFPFAAPVPPDATLVFRRPAPEFAEPDFDYRRLVAPWLSPQQPPPVVDTTVVFGRRPAEELVIEAEGLPPRRLAWLTSPGPAPYQELRGVHGGLFPTEDALRRPDDEAVALALLLALGWFD